VLDSAVPHHGKRSWRGRESNKNTFSRSWKFRLKNSNQARKETRKTLRTRGFKQQTHSHGKDKATSSRTKHKTKSITLSEAKYKKRSSSPTASLPYLPPPKSELFPPTSTTRIKTLLSKTRTRSQRPHLFKTQKVQFKCKYADPGSTIYKIKSKLWGELKADRRMIGTPSFDLLHNLKHLAFALLFRSRRFPHFSLP
jgi:hypothetical protein